MGNYGTLKAEPPRAKMGGHVNQPKTYVAPYRPDTRRRVELEASAERGDRDRRTHENRECRELQALADGGRKRRQ